VLALAVANRSQYSINLGFGVGIAREVHLVAVQLGEAAQQADANIGEQIPRRHRCKV
jgi:hypothetical protein